MLFGDDSVELHGDCVRIQRNAVTIATGRWREGRIIEREGRLGSPDDDAAWLAIESALGQEGEAFLAMSAAAAYDDRGVDVTQIDRMLSMTPAERLEFLDDERRSVAQITNYAPRD